MLTCRHDSGVSDVHQECEMSHLAHLTDRLVDLTDDPEDGHSFSEWDENIWDERMDQGSCQSENLLAENSYYCSTH